MKKTALMMLLAVLLSACAPRAIRPTEQQPSEMPETAAQTEPVQTEPAAAGENFWDSPEHMAFQKALIQIHDELLWPELPDAGRIELWEPGTIEDEQFAIFDVDGDGADELLVSIANTYTAGMCEVIYGYDVRSGRLRAEAWNYVGVTHYPGMLRVDASHNHGYAGDVLWPYSMLAYEEGTDTYNMVCSVDAWKKEITDYDPYRDMPYPEDIDTEQDGFVYLITENGELKILNRADYETREAELFAGKEPLTVPWQNMTLENIGLGN